MANTRGDRRHDGANYDVCIVGAGIAGLNAAFVASRYLPSSGRVLLLDRRDSAGGMWNDAYPYVRLHQPYEMFTVGNIGWRLRRGRGYLAARDEVAAHLRHCLEAVASQVDLDARWGWEYLSHTEDDTGVTIFARDRQGREHSLRALRFVQAAGFDIEVVEPLALSSAAVRSIAPQHVAEAGLLVGGDSAPVWVVGSGKTAIDTAHALISARPDRSLGLVTGSGTYFFNRDVLYPKGAACWWAGLRPTQLFSLIADRYDGTNAEAMARWAQTRFATSPVPAAVHNAFGLLSGAETATVAAGVKMLVRDHLLDVADDGGRPSMVLRSGARHPVVEGSWIVNCTGYLYPRDVEQDPYLSAGGRVLSINSTSTTLGFTSVGGYFLTHLLFLNRLANAPLYALDFHDARRKTPEDLPWVLSTLLMHNFSVIAERLPRRALAESHLDFDRWFPLPRRIVGQLRFLSSHKRKRARRGRTLDGYSRRTGVRCAPLAASAGEQDAALTAVGPR